MQAKSVSTGTPVEFRRAACGSRDRVSRQNSGFTLLETLVGLTVLAIALSSLLGLYTEGMRVAQAGGQHARAQVLARSLLELSTARTTRAPTPATGATNEFRWRVFVEPASAGLVDEGRSSKWRLYYVSAEIQWDGNRRYRLETLKLAGAQ